MPFFLVGYDLKTNQGEKRDYNPIEEALEDLDSCHTQDSVWYVEHTGTARQLYDLLKTKVEDRDRLMVVEFSKKPSWQKALPGTNAWLDNRFP